MLDRRKVARLALSLAVLVALGSGVPALAQKDVPQSMTLESEATQSPVTPCKVVDASLTGSTRIYKGACPVTIKFLGAVKAAGTITAKNPCTVTYIFTRSDGATDTEVKTLTFTAPGSKPVSTTWQLGGSSLPHYLGWEALKILSPNPLESAHADFEIFCSVQPNRTGKRGAQSR